MRRWSEIVTSGVDRETQIVLQALDMAVPDGEGAYLSCPISTGRRYYQALAEYGAADIVGLVERIGEQAYRETVRWPNVEDAERIAAGLRRNGVAHLINTSTLLIDSWRGHHYMDLCYQIIARKVYTVYFHPEWAFSTGAVEEYLHCRAAGKLCLTVDGEPLTIDMASAALREAIEAITSMNLPTAKMESFLALL